MQTHDHTVTKETDVLVIGAGAAGYVAALRAAADRAAVTIIEAGDAPGGTMRRSSGGYWVPNNSYMRSRGIDDPEADALRYMAKIAYPTTFDDDSPTFGVSTRDFELLKTIYTTTAEAVDWLSDSGSLKSTEMIGYNGVKGEFPSYQDLPEYDRAPFGRHLGPEYTEESLERARASLSRAQGHNAAEPGSQGDGQELWRQLDMAAERSQIELLTNHRARRLLQDETGAVVGAEVDTASGTVLIRARQGVVLAMGGFSQDAELSDSLLRGPIVGTAAVPTSVGDAIRMTRDLGVELDNTENAWWAQVPLEPALQNRNMDWLAFVPFGDSMIIVNSDGDRVVNEKDIYDRRTRAHFAGGVEAGFPQRILVMVYDEAVAANPLDWQPRWPVPLPEGRLSVRASDIDERTLPIRGDSIEDLAQNIAARLEGISDKTAGFALDPNFADGLRHSIERFNAHAESGVDTDFHRGETAVELGFHGPAREGNGANPTMAPFQESGPYYAILMGAGTLDTKGGPRIDSAARILRRDNGEPIPGLFGAGNCVAQPTGEGYFSGGATLGAAIAFGYLAGIGAASRTSIAN